MNRTAKIYVAGHEGLVGSALMRELRAQGYTNLITQSYPALDLRNQSSVEQFFAQEQPEYVFLAAAKVGGIYANATYPADFIYDNLMIASNVIHAAHRFKVRRLLFLGSSCIYPRNCAQPIKEDYLLTGALEATNEPYAIAKIAGLKLCEAYNRQYGTEFMSVMPTNLYGPGDNFDLNHSHVIPALIAKFHQAKIEGHEKVVLWGTGAARREFLYVDDLASAVLFLMSASVFEKNVLNIGTGFDLTIAELGTLIKKVVGYEGQIMFDATKPDGTPRKLLDVSRMQSLGWQARTSLEDGLAKTYAWYCDQQTADLSRHSVTLVQTSRAKVESV